MRTSARAYPVNEPIAGGAAVVEVFCSVPPEFSNNTAIGRLDMIVKTFDFVAAGDAVRTPTREFRSLLPHFHGLIESAAIPSALTAH